MKPTSLLALFLSVWLTAGCADSASTTSPTPTTATTSTEIFAGTLDPGGSSFYSFSVTQGGVVTVNLASLTTGSSVRTTSAAVVGLGIGIPSGTDCAVSTSTETSAALAAQMTNERTAGTYCVRVHDVGQLEVPLNFAIRIVHP